MFFQIGLQFVDEKGRFSCSLGQLSAVVEDLESGDLESGDSNLAGGTQIGHGSNSGVLHWRDHVGAKFQEQWCRMGLACSETDEFQIVKFRGFALEPAADSNSREENSSSGICCFQSVSQENRYRRSWNLAPT